MLAEMLVSSLVEQRGVWKVAKKDHKKDMRSVAWTADNLASRWALSMAA